MGTTNTMGIPYPESTDAVANGATAMQSLAETVDAKTGLVLVKSVTVGVTATSVPVTGAFSAAWDNYLISYTNGTGSALGDMRMILGSTSSNYFNQLIYGNYASTVLAFGGNFASFSYVGGTDTNEANCDILLEAPFLTKRTKCFSRYSNTAAGVQFMGILDDTISYADFTLFTGAGTITGGQINVYGYGK
jgi:hypothetical protein